MKLQKKYRWKVLNRVVKETFIDNDGFIHLPTLIGEAVYTFRGYPSPELPKEMPSSLFLYLHNIYGLQKNETNLLWSKYCNKINHYIKNEKRS